MEEKDEWIKENNLYFNNPYDAMIVSACWDKGIRDPHLVRMSISISRFETNDYQKFAAKNNFGGMLNTPATKEAQANGYKGAVWYIYPTPERGVSAFVSNLYKNYYSQGLTTVNDVQKRYAKNDGVSKLTTNPNWVPGVQSKYEKVASGKSFNNDGSLNADSDKAKTFTDATISKERSKEEKASNTEDINRLLNAKSPKDLKQNTNPLF